MKTINWTENNKKIITDVKLKFDTFCKTIKFFCFPDQALSANTVRALLYHAVCIFFTHFQKANKTRFFQGGFFRKLCLYVWLVAVCNQERDMIVRVQYLKEMALM